MPGKKKVVKLHIDDWRKRENVVVGIAAGGYKVWIEIKVKTYPDPEKMLVCFEVDENEVEAGKC